MPATASIPVGLTFDAESSLITIGLTPLGLLIVSCFSGKGTTLFGTPKTRYFDKKPIH